MPLTGVATMDPLSIGLMTAGSSLLGSWFSSDTSAKNTQANINAQMQMQKQSQDYNEAMAQRTMNFQADQAEIQRRYQTDMSNTAYQRSRADMEKAGLNPILAANAGGASTPPGAMASGATPQTSAPNMMGAYNKQSPLAGLGDAISKAVSTAISAKTYDKMTDEIANIRADTAKRNAEIATEKERPAAVRAGTLLTEDQAATLANRMPAARLEGVTAKDILDMPAWLRTTLVQAGFASDKVAKAADVVGSGVSSALGIKRLFPQRSTVE